MRGLRFIWMAVLLPLAALTQVNVNNGNFYVSYSDLTLGKSEWSVERVYNSFATDNGLFGKGWGSNLATRLWSLPDGQLLVIHYGSGGEDLYVPARLDRKGIFQMIDSILADEIKRNKLQRTPTDVTRRRAALFSDATRRASAYVRALANAGIDCPVSAERTSTFWVNEYRESETIRWEKGLFLLKRYDDQYYFDRCGRLVRWVKAADDIRFTYSSAGRLLFITRGSDTARVELDKEGKVSSVFRTDSAGRRQTSSYLYNADGLLTHTVDVDSNVYVYEYDRNFNMIFTRYMDGSYRRIEYDPATNRTIGFRERTGDSSRYEYGYMYLPDGRLNTDHYYTRVVRYDSLGKRVFGTYTETEFRYKENGDNYRYRYYFKSDTLENLYVYPPNVGNAIYARSNQREAWQSYDAKTRPIYLRLNDSVYLSRYNLMNLPERFQAIDSVKRDTTTYAYSYNAKGLLIQAQLDQVAYRVMGSVSAGRVDLWQNNKKWAIGFEDGRPVYFIDPVQGRLSVEALELPANQKVQIKFRQLLGLAKPLKIEHEWIWDRL